MKITFKLKEDGGRPYSHLRANPLHIYYEAYVADLEITCGELVETLSGFPMLDIVSGLHRSISESYLTGREAKEFLWDSGESLALYIENATIIVLEIPKGTTPLRYPLGEFVIALRRITLELLWMMYDDGLLTTDAQTGLLTDWLFWPGSVLHQAAQLIVSGELSGPIDRSHLSTASISPAIFVDGHPAIQAIVVSTLNTPIGCNKLVRIQPI